MSRRARDQRILPHLHKTIAEEGVFGTLVFDQTESCVFVNSAARFLLSTEAPELRSLVPANLSAQIKPFSLDLLNNDGFYQDILVAKADGGTFIANVGVRRIEVDGMSGHLLMLQDITIQKRLQRDIIAKQLEIHDAYEELMRQNTALKQLDMAKDRFIALTAHELRTPLAAMVASAEILKLGIYDNEEQMREFIGIIYDQGFHLQDLVNDILDFAKIQAGKMEIYLQKQDPLPLAQTILREFEGMAEGNGITLHLHGGGEGTGERTEREQSALACYFDDVRLRQILSNIISNAIKYNRPNGRVDVTFTDIGGRIKISVHDTGKGIPLEQFDKVFNEFDTLDQIAQHHKGTGLGMPISRKLAEGMGGALTLESEVGVGSVFSVELTKEKVLAEEFYRSRTGNSIIDAAQGKARAS